MARPRQAPDRYEAFIAELADFLAAAGLTPEGGLRGATEPELASLERHLPRPLPAAVRAFLRTMGRHAGGLGEALGVWDVLGDGLPEARQFAEQIPALAEELAEALASGELQGEPLDPAAAYRPDPLDLPLTQSADEWLCLVRLDQGEDPPVRQVSLDEGLVARAIAPSFTAFLREAALGQVEHRPWNDEVCREIAAHRDHWLPRKRLLDQWDEEAHALRRALLDEVQQHDAQRGAITGPAGFQRLWLDRLAGSPLAATLQQQGKRLPWGWLTPDEAAGR